MGRRRRSGSSDFGGFGARDGGTVRACALAHFTKESLPMSRSVALAAVLLSAIVGCAAPSGDDADSSSESALGGALPISSAQEYAIFHGQDYSVEHFADMGKGLFPVVGNVFEPGGPGHMIAEAGKPLVIDYDRVVSQYNASPCPASTPDTYVIQPSCGEMSCGDGPMTCSVYKLYTKVLLHYQFAGGAVQTVNVAPYMSTGEGIPSRATIAIPASAVGDLAYWFELTRGDGSTEWDSKFGKNYHVEVLAPAKATIRFDSSWNQSADGPITAGSTLRIAYDRERLVHQVWGDTKFSPNSIRIDAFVSFDGAAPIVLPIDEDYGSLLQPLVHVPAGARGVTMWFKGEGDVYVAPAGSSTPVREHHVAWDSKFGANYSFAVSP